MASILEIRKRISGQFRYRVRVDPLMLLSRQLFFDFNSIVSCIDSWLMQEDAIVCFIDMSEGGFSLSTAVVSL
jgi:hypothetical protein